MSKIEIIETKKNHYKIISNSTHKHPALIEIAKLLKHNNKTSNIKIGIYSIPNQPFSLFQSVYSYISKRTDRMSKKSFYEFLKGKRQIKPVSVPDEELWLPQEGLKAEDEEDKLHPCEREINHKRFFDFLEEI